MFQFVILRVVEGSAAHFVIESGAGRLRRQEWDKYGVFWLDVEEISLWHCCARVIKKNATHHQGLQMQRQT